jgi:thiamine biosynthesis lipoprotein
VPPAADVAAVHSREGRALGSALRLHLEDTGCVPSARQVDAAWRAVVDEFELVDRSLSRFRDDSELTALNRRAGEGGTAVVSWRLRSCLALMGRAARTTGHRFDPTFVGELERLGEHGASLLVQPSAASGGEPALDRPRPVVVPPVPLDSGGIGKGLALRWAASRLGQLLPESAGFLLEAGGDLVAGGRVSTPWRLGIEDPVVPRGAEAEPLAVVSLVDGALATSSVAIRRWQGPDGRQVHHLLDPRTREPARTGLLSVTVAAPDPAWAEVWTKALFVAGSGSIRDDARARGLAAWWVDAGGALGMTPAAREHSVWVAEPRVG